MLPRLIALVGATATGKTAIGEALAEKLGGTIVCADARQVYRELEVGTGKPTPAERKARPHALFDLASLGERVTAGSWARAATETCQKLFAEGITPILVGGSGLYVSALERGLHPEPPKDPERRAELERESAERGPEAMHARLQELDPSAAASLRPRDRQRVLRALEIVEGSGHTLAWWRESARSSPLAAEWRTFEVTCEPAILAARISERTAVMWRDGLLEETRAIVEAGKGPALRRLAAIGYDEAMDVLEGLTTPEAARESMDRRTRQLAKRQRTWFRHQLRASTVAGTSDEAERIAARIARDALE